MIEIFKKTYLAGADFAHKTWDEVEGRANEVIKKAKLGEKERAKFLKDLKKRYDGTQGKLEKYVEKVVKNILQKMDIATGAEIKALQKEIRLLKKANSRASTPKRTRSTTAKKSTASGAKKRSTATATKKRSTTTAAKKRTTANAKKSTKTGSKKRATAASTKKRTAKGTKK
jgi:polyhydroxyalkanoate synthesis regulator phasin